MARIPGVPELGAVEKPYMSPQQAGRAGMAVADLAETSADISDTGLAIQAHIREAQKHVDNIAASNELNAAYTATQDELAKTQNSRDVSAILKQSQDNLNNISKKWSNSPASVEIQMQADSLRPNMSHMASMRQVTLMGKELDANNDLQIKNLMPQLVTAIRNGDTATAQQIRDHVSSLYDTPLVSEANKKLAMDAFQEATQKQLNEAAITSASPAERSQAISQLTKGGSGPLDLTNLAPGDVSALRVHAEETNERLNNLSEAGQLNGALNATDSAFQAPEFKHNYEARINALQDGQWLKDHGIVAQDGSPDRVMAEKLIAETNRQRGEWEKEQADQDQKLVEKYSPEIDENHMSRAQIDAIPGLSPRGRSALIRQWTENNRIDRQLATSDRQEARQAREDQSGQIMGNFLMDIAQGKILDPVDVRTTAGLLPRDKAQLVSTINEAKTNKDYQTGMSVLANAFSIPKTATPEQADRLSEAYAETYKAWVNRVNQNPGMDKSLAAQEVLAPKIQKQISDALDQRFGVPPAPTLKQTLRPIALFSLPLQAIYSALPDDSTAASQSFSGGSITPKEGDTKKNSAGVDVVYRNGKWDYK